MSVYVNEHIYFFHLFMKERCVCVYLNVTYTLFHYL